MFTILFAVANLLSLRSCVDVAVDVDAPAADSVVLLFFLLFSCFAKMKMKNENDPHIHSSTNTTNTQKPWSTVKAHSKIAVKKAHGNANSCKMRLHQNLQCVKVVVCCLYPCTFCCRICFVPIRSVLMWRLL